VSPNAQSLNITHTVAVVFNILEGKSIIIAHTDVWISLSTKKEGKKKEKNFNQYLIIELLSYNEKGRVEKKTFEESFITKPLSYN
jgi:hypothetical protein